MSSEQEVQWPQGLVLPKAPASSCEEVDTLSVVFACGGDGGSAEVSVSNESLRPEGKVSRELRHIKSKGPKAEEPLLGRGLLTSCFWALLHLKAGCSAAAGPGSPRVSAKNSAASGVSEALTLGRKKQQALPSLG